MRADQAIERVREWRHYNYSGFLPSAVVIAETDWLAYVQAMAASLPEDELAYPAEDDVLWAWPDGVLIVFSEPLDVEHTIISRSTRASGFKTLAQPVDEAQRVAALCIASKRLIQPQTPDGQALPSVYAYPRIWIGTDASDIVSGHWTPGAGIHPSGETISTSSRLIVAMITALGHRLTRHAEPAGTRGERRRAERELPGLRVLELASGATVQRSTDSSVEWSRRWMVRGHWRLQPHGPGRSLRRPTWIDPYVKGPADKPLDVRETLWKTTLPEGAP